MDTMDKTIPKIVFIVPYRNREEHKRIFLQHMKEILNDYRENEYEIIFSHQTDKREFNRGAMKNVGFLSIKQKYPHDYKDITFVFHDIDTFPRDKHLIHYETNHGIVKHFYGFKFALGGIVSIKGHDFERINGYPNLWGWGFEDNSLQGRVLQAKIEIDRSEFYPFKDERIIQLEHGKERKLDNMVVHKFKDFTNGLNKINEHKYNIENIDNNIYIVNHLKWNIPEREKDIIYESRNSPSRVFQRKVNMGNIMKWSNKQR